MKKVLIVINSAKFFISHRIPIAVEAKKQGFDVEVALPYISEDDKIILESENISFKEYYLDKTGLNPFKELLSFFSLLKLLLFVKPNVIHLVTIKPVLYGGVLARILRIPTLVAISGMGFLYKKDKNRILRFISNKVYKFIFSNKNVCLIVQNINDKKILDGLKKINQNSVFLLPGSGVDLTKFYYSKPNIEEIIFLMPCRMLWDKGVKEFVEAAVKIKEKYPDVKFILSGPYEDRNPGKVPLTFLNKLNKDGIVNWIGEIDDMVGIYEKSSVVVAPSYYNEGMPKVLLEAAACGRASITTDMPGCRDAIEENLTGLLVPQQNVIALSKAMEKLILNSSSIERMSHLARTKAEREFSIDKVVAKHIDLYRKLVKKD